MSFISTTLDLVVVLLRVCVCVVVDKGKDVRIVLLSFDFLALVLTLPWSQVLHKMMITEDSYLQGNRIWFLTIICNISPFTCQLGQVKKIIFRMYYNWHSAAAEV